MLEIILQGRILLQRTCFTLARFFDKGDLFIFSVTEIQKMRKKDNQILFIYTNISSDAKYPNQNKIRWLENRKPTTKEL